MKKRSPLLEAMKEAKEKGIKCSHGGTELDDFLASRLWNIFPYSLSYHFSEKNTSASKGGGARKKK